MRYGSFIDKIPEEFKPDMEGWAHIAMAALIAVLISSLIVLALLPAKAAIEDIDRLGAQDAALQDSINAINDAGPYATMADIDNVNTSLSEYALDVINLKWRVTATENAIAELEPAAYAAQFSDYQLYIAGNGSFTANIYLAIEPVLATNATSHSDAVAFFYAGVNFTTASQDYIPVATFNGSGWIITQAWFNIGKLDIINDATIDIIVDGLDSYTIEYAYAEVHEL